MARFNGLNGAIVARFEGLRHFLSSRLSALAANDRACPHPAHPDGRLTLNAVNAPVSDTKLRYEQRQQIKTESVAKDLQLLSAFAAKSESIHPLAVIGREQLQAVQSAGYLVRVDQGLSRYPAVPA